MCSPHLLLLIEVALGLLVWGAGPGGAPRFPRIQLPPAGGHRHGEGPLPGVNTPYPTD